MATTSLNQLKKELATRTHTELVQVCLSLTKLKAENKEMLSYLLFDSDDPLSYAQIIKEEMDVFLWQVSDHTYALTKGLRKALGMITKYSRFTKSKQGEIELLLHFLTRYLEKTESSVRYPALLGLAYRALRKIYSLIGKLHEDLQFDYTQEYNQKVDDIRSRMYNWDHNRFPLLHFH